MGSVLLQVRMDKELKEAVAEIFDEIGLDIPTAVRIFFKAVAREKRIPLDLKAVSDEKTDGVVNDDPSLVRS